MKDKIMSQHIQIELEVSAELDKFKLPTAVDERLQYLLDRQDQGNVLTSAERMEAEGWVSLTELLSLLRLRSRNASPSDAN